MFEVDESLLFGFGTFFGWVMYCCCGSTTIPVLDCCDHHALACKRCEVIPKVRHCHISTDYYEVTAIESLRVGCLGSSETMAEDADREERRGLGRSRSVVRVASLCCCQGRSLARQGSIRYVWQLHAKSIKELPPALGPELTLDINGSTRAAGSVKIFGILPYLISPSTLRSLGLSWPVSSLAACSVPILRLTGVATRCRFCSALVDRPLAAMSDRRWSGEQSRTGRRPCHRGGTCPAQTPAEISRGSRAPPSTPCTARRALSGSWSLLQVRFGIKFVAK